MPRGGAEASRRRGQRRVRGGVQVGAETSQRRCPGGARDESEAVSDTFGDRHRSAGRPQHRTNLSNCLTTKGVRHPYAATTPVMALATPLTPKHYIQSLCLPKVSD